MVPAAMPPSRPVVASIVPTVGSTLLQVPPPDASLKVVVEPSQTVCEPVIAAGNGLTVTTAVV